MELPQSFFPPFVPRSEREAIRAFLHEYLKALRGELQLQEDILVSEFERIKTYTKNAYTAYAAHRARFNPVLDEILRH